MGQSLNAAGQGNYISRSILYRYFMYFKNNIYLNSSKQIVLIGISFNYIERAAGITEGPIFDIEWKTEVKSI